MIIEHNKSLKNFNSFGVQCFAEKFINIKKEDDIIESIEYLKKTKHNHFILGGGSNILLTQNIKGAVLHNLIDGINIIKESNNNVTIKVGAGVIWNDFVNWSIKKKLWGIENLILIPGTVGAAPIQNIGAYGAEIKDVIKNVTGFNISTGQKIIFNKHQCEFEYRNSIFKKKLKNIFFITEIQVTLNKKGNPNLNYDTLKNELEKENKPISLKKIGLTVSRIRKSKLPDPKKIGNAGSFFKNPIIELNKLEEIKRKYPEIKYYNLNEKVKISAGWLIEKSGWKEKKLQNCSAYNKQALVLINHGDATGIEINNLANEIILDINAKFGIQLQKEVQIF